MLICSCFAPELVGIATTIDLYIVVAVVKVLSWCTRV